MRNIRIGMIIALISIVAAGAFVRLNRAPESAANEHMELTSTSFLHNESIPKHYTCDGDDVNPPLLIADVPDGAESLALIVDDPDAPSQTWVHWLVWNIDPTTEEIGEGETPGGATEGMTSFETIGYGGPCPPAGVHRYFFKLYALDTTLSLDEERVKDDLLNAMDGHILETAELVGRYERE